MLKEFVPLFKGLSCDGIFHVRKVSFIWSYSMFVAVENANVCFYLFRHLQFAVRTSAQYWMMIV